VALAQSAAVLSAHNADFMRGLIAYRYYDLAEALAKTVAASNLPETEKSNIAIIAADINDPAVGASGAGRKDAILQAIKLREDRIAKDPASNDADILRAEVTDHYGKLANAYKDAIGEEKDPQKQAALRKEGDELFRTAEARLAAFRDEAAKNRKEDKPETEVPYLIAFFNLGRMKYYHSLLFAPDSIECHHAVDQAIEMLEDFGLEYSDRLVAFEAKLIVSLCHKQEGKRDDAIASAEEAIALRERVEKDPKGVYKLDDDAASVVSKGFAQKIAFLKEVESDEQRWDKIIALAKDYLTTTPNPLKAEMGLGVLAEQAEAYFNKGDTAQAKAGAEQLIDEDPDPRGRWRIKGRQLLASIAGNGTPIGPVTTGDLTKLVNAAADFCKEDDLDQALALCRQVMRRATGPDNAKVAADAMMVTGVAFYKRNANVPGGVRWLEESSAAYDFVWRHYPETPSAPEALWRALNCYNELRGAIDNPFWRKKVDECSRILREKYPDNPNVPRLQLVEAIQLEKALKFAEAAAAFEKIPVDTSLVSVEARTGAANCYLKQARKLGTAKGAEAKELQQKAKDGFKKLVDDLAALIKTTTDPKVKKNLEENALRVRINLANLYLQEKPPLAAEIEALLKDVTTPDSAVWALRIGALAAQDKVDEAVAMFDSAQQSVEKEKLSAQPLAEIAGTLAARLDERAAAKDKAGQHSEARDLWKRSVPFYLRAAERSSGPDELAQIANRLFVLGLVINGLDEKAAPTFFELADQKFADPSIWEQAAELFDRLIKGEKASYTIKIYCGRALGFLKRWQECADVLEPCMQEVKLVDARNQLDSRVWTQKPDLIPSYLELGFALRNAGLAAHDNTQLAHASQVFERIAAGTRADSKSWWYARYGLLRTLVDRGEYKDADVMMSIIQRGSPDFDNDQYKLRAKFLQLKSEIKVPKGN
jgi:tetratricopeptide (TPR) repeat protein